MGFNKQEQEYRELNEFQTHLSELEDKIPKEVYLNILMYIDEVEFIKNLVDVNIPRINELPKDEEGKLIIFKKNVEGEVTHNYITKPHVLENMDYFRQSALHFKKYGVYTLETPNPHPKSKYTLFWKEETRRCREGLIRPDGEWIPGELYFYWNYCPIMLSREVVGTKKANRVQDFPDPWLGDYLWFHYKNAARNEGEHCAKIKCRGIGASFKGGVTGPYRTLHFKKQKTFYVAYEKEYLTKDGILNKAWDYMDFIAQNTPWPRMRLTDSLNKMMLKLGYKDLSDGTEKGTLGEIIGISVKDDPDKPRGKRGSILVEEFGKFPRVTDTHNIMRPSVEDGDFAFDQIVLFGCVCAGTKVLTNEGAYVNIEDLQKEDGIIGYDIEEGKVSQEPIIWQKPPAKKECVRITTNMGKVLECSIDHPIYASNSKNKRCVTEFSWIEACKLKEKDYVAIPNEIDIFGDLNMWQPRLVGLLIGDGSYGYNQSVKLTNCDEGVINYVEDNFDTNSKVRYITKEGKTLKDIGIRGIRPELRKLGIIDQTKNNKTLPLLIHKYNKKSISELISGFFDADGYVNVRKNKSRKDSWLIEISASSSSRLLLESFQQQLIKFGVHSKIRTRLPKLNKLTSIKDVNEWHELVISDITSALNFGKNFKLLCKHKNERLNIILELGKKKKPQHAHSKFRKERVIKIESIGLCNIYNLNAGNTHTYLANNIITHNTGGSEGADFQGAEDMMYHPETYKILALPNVFDKNTNGQTSSIFHWGSYLARKGCINPDGMPDVVKALKEVCGEFYRIKSTSSDSKALTQRKAELAITIQDAIMRVDGTVFPVGDLKDYLESIAPTYSKMQSSHYIGELVMNKKTVEFKPNATLYPITKFPFKPEHDNEKIGAVEIFEMPKTNAEGIIDPMRYILGSDPVDDDEAVYSVSLTSVFVFDLYTDRIVAEYTGRPKYADQYYEICRRLAMLYNGIINYEQNKKGLFSYFSNHHCVHLLCDTPEILRDMDMAKGGSYGNKAKGTNATNTINGWARRLQAQWLIKPAYTQEFDEDGKQVGNKLNLHTIRSKPLIEEYIKWNPDINADRVSAMGMVMILREDRLKYIQSGNREERTSGSDMSNDDYFNSWGNSHDEDWMNESE